MKRVVVTGMGIVSSIGNNTQEVLASLREARSGIVRADRYAELGFRCQVHGAPDIDAEAMLDRRAMRFHGGGTAWNHIAMDQAIRDGGFEPEDVSNERTGIIMGSGGPSTRAIVEAADITRGKGPKRVGPFVVPKAMSSTASATLATWFKIKGVNYSISSACATSNHCIGNAYETIQLGKQDVIFAGGCEELDWTLSVLFDGMGAMSTHFNDRPAVASRAYDKDRDGFVIAGGAGVLALEELEHAKARGARIYGEIVGYGATSDGFDMVSPSGEGAGRCMQMALESVGEPVDYINPHATSTQIGDLKEIEAIREVFGDKCPPISGTKSLTGHSLGATGVQEAIYCLLMMQNGFIAKSANIDELDPAFADVPIVRERIDNVELNTVLSNSFGFGGTNASLVFQRYNG
ncbi:MAG TPA: beta-ketoacyl-ACP synthase I [Bauldia sp.]|nr:beta-ketoacyl-ACP synthase I [Bauldia sp.]